MKGHTLSIVLLATILISSCSSHPQENGQSNSDWFPPANLKDTDLIGTWSSETSGASSTEILTLRENRAFTQTFTILSSGQNFEAQGTWSIVKTPQGCTYVHADGMRYYHGPALLAQNGNREPDGTPYPFWDGCQKKLVEMPDFVLLGIGHDSRQNSRIFLYYMSLDAETSPPVLWKNDPTLP